MKMCVSLGDFLWGTPIDRNNEKSDRNAWKTYKFDVIGKSNAPNDEIDDFEPWYEKKKKKKTVSRGRNQGHRLNNPMK